MVTALEYRHVPTGTLAVLAQRLGKVWASPSTWYRLVRQNGWRRPRLRVLPHSAFHGQAPAEMYFGTRDAAPADLQSGAAAARRTRVEANRSASCEICPSAVRGRVIMEC